MFGKQYLWYSDEDPEVLRGSNPICYQGNLWDFRNSDKNLGIFSYHHHHHHHHHADIYNAPITTKQEHKKCSTKIQIVVDETY